MPAMYCAPPTKIVQMHFGHAKDGARVASATLANGERILFSIEKGSGNEGFVSKMNSKHPMQVCYGPDGSQPLAYVFLGDLTNKTTAYGFILPSPMPEPTQ